MKRYLLLIAVMAGTLSSFTNFTTYSKTELLEDDWKKNNLEEKKAILTSFYSNLIKNEIDKRFNESEDGNINEKEMIENLVLLTDYGCAYSNSNCTGTQVCGVSELYARTFGYGSYKSYSSLPCKPTGGQP